MAYIERRTRKGKDGSGSGTTRYYVRYYENGKRKSLPGGFSRKKDAKEALNRMLAEMAAETYGKPEIEK